MSLGFHDTSGFYHLRHITPVNLDAHGPFFISNGELIDR